MSRVLLSICIGFIIFGGSALASMSTSVFWDLHTDHWASTSVEWAIHKEMIQGYPDGSFGPDKTVTGAEFLSMLTNAYKQSIKLPEVSREAAWDEDIWVLGQNNNWILNSRYEPIKRKHIAELIGSAMGYACTVDEYIMLLLQTGVSSGKTGNTITGYAGEEYLTRAEAIEFVRKTTLVVDKLTNKPAQKSSNCPILPVTKGGYTLTPHDFSTGVVQIERTFDSQNKDIAIVVMKGEEKEIFVFEINNFVLNERIPLKLGPGTYLIEVYERKDAKKGEYVGTVWGQNSFRVVSTYTDHPKLLPTYYSQSDDGQIVQLANQITNNATSDYEKTKAIYEYTSTAITYDMVAYFDEQVHLQTAIDVLNTGKGLCTDYATLTVALNRAAQIPARVVTGIAGSRNTDGKINHAWVEVFVDGRWIVQDPTWGAGKIDIHNKTFTPLYNDAYFDPPRSFFEKTHRRIETFKKI